MKKRSKRNDASDKSKATDKANETIELDSDDTDDESSYKKVCQLSLHVLIA